MHIQISSKKLKMSASFLVKIKCYVGDTEQKMSPLRCAPGFAATTKYAAHQGSHIPPGAGMVGTRLRASDGLFLWVFIMVLHERHKGLTGV